MFLIEALSRETELPVSDTVEVRYSAFGLILILWMNHRPKSRNDEINVRSQRNHTVIAHLDIAPNFELPALVKVVYIKALI